MNRALNYNHNEAPVTFMTRASNYNFKNNNEAQASNNNNNEARVKARVTFMTRASNYNFKNNNDNNVSRASIKLGSHLN